MFTYIQCGCVSVNVRVCTFMYCYVQFVPIWKCGISVCCTLWFICFAPAASVLPQSLSFSLYLWIFHSSLVFPCPCVNPVEHSISEHSVFIHCGFIDSFNECKLRFISFVFVYWFMNVVVIAKLILSRRTKLSNPDFDLSNSICIEDFVKIRHKTCSEFEMKSWFPWHKSTFQWICWWNLDWGQYVFQLNLIHCMQMPTSLN